jgi:hypothetical protein
MWYDVEMREQARLTAEEVQVAHERLLEAVHLHEIEGNPLSTEDLAMFEMFEREAWSHDRCIASILAQAAPDVAAE